MGLYSPSLRGPECRPAYCPPNVSLLGRSLLPSFCHLLLAGLRLGEQHPRHSPAYYSSDPAPAPSHNTGPSTSPFSLSTTFGRAAPYPWFLGVSCTGQWRPGCDPPTVCKTTPHAPPHFLCHQLLVRQPHSAGYWNCAFLPELAHDAAPPTALKAPPTIHSGPASPAHYPGSPLPQRRKISWGPGVGRKAPIPPTPLGSAPAPSAP